MEAPNLPVPPEQLPPAVREYLMKERQTLLDRLVCVERQLGLPSSVLTKREREVLRRSQHLPEERTR